MRYDSGMIIPSILSDQVETIQSQLDQLTELDPRPEVIQLDIVDGEFADNITIEPVTVRELSYADCQLDVHLITVEPTQYLEELVGAPAIRTVIAQVERLSRFSDFAQTALEQQWACGFALDIYTPVETITEIAQELTEEQRAVWTIVQIMGNRAGAQGEPLHQAVLDRIREAVDLRTQLGLSFRILVDIGVNDLTWPTLQAAGADDGVVGSYLWQGGSSGLAAHWQKLLVKES
jgi:pentose-5-phosphate-3-epimerase